MEPVSPEERAEELIASPAGCALLLCAEQGELSAEDLATPAIGLFAISQAIGEISPWKSDHDWIVAKVLEHGPRVRNRPPLRHRLVVGAGQPQSPTLAAPDRQLHLARGVVGHPTNRHAR